MIYLKPFDKGYTLITYDDLVDFLNNHTIKQVDSDEINTLPNNIPNLIKHRDALYYAKDDEWYIAFINRIVKGKDIKYIYKCDQLTGLINLSNSLQPNINESINQHNYTTITYENLLSFIETHTIEPISNKEINILPKDLTEHGSKFINHQLGPSSGNEWYSSHIYIYSKDKTIKGFLLIKIVKYSDEWYILQLTKKSGGTSNKITYKCDQLLGLTQLIDMIYNIYTTYNNNDKRFLL